MEIFLKDFLFMRKDNILDQTVYLYIDLFSDIYVVFGSVYFLLLIFCIYGL